jgi:predicted ATPase/DNA-binding winged helix-turn-helix (wHTH) protein
VDWRGKWIYALEPWEIDLGRRELRGKNGTLVPLGSRAFGVLEVLVRSAGDLISTSDLMEAVWPGVFVQENTLHFHIAAIRKGLGADRALLATVSGRGYRLIGDWTVRQRTTEVGPADCPPRRSPTPPAQSNLPIPASNIVGQTSAVARAQDLMSAFRAVTLTGPGGIGKTRLALEIARRLLPGFQGDVWFVDLATLSDAGLVAAAIAGVLGLRLGRNDIPPESLAHAIGVRRLLLIIDNCEHVINAAAEVVETLLRMCPGSSVLATSREAMRIEGEFVYRVPPLDVPGPSEVNRDHVLESSAVQLFIARTTGPLAAPHQDELSIMAAICRRLDGIPLAIEFAAARAETLGLKEVLSRLDDRFTLLTSGRRTALPKHRTLRATLDWSYELLSDQERLVLQHLAIFTGFFSLEAAGAVTGGTEVSPPEITETIGNLVAKSLVHADFTRAMVPFRLLETTRAYALERLAESGDYPQLARRHARYFWKLLGTIANDPETEGHFIHLGNVRAALEWCFGAGGDAEIGVGLASFAALLLLALSLLSECLLWAQRALLALDDASRGGPEEMRLQGALGTSLAYTYGNSETARLALSRSLAIAEERDYTTHQLQMLGILHTFHHRAGDFETARCLARRSIVVARAIAKPDALALARALMGVSLHHRGDLNGARVELEAALQDRPGSQPINATYLGFDARNIAGVVMARTLWLQGYPEQAVERARQTVKDAALGDHQVTLAIALVWSISVFLWVGDLSSAEEHLDWLMSCARSYSLGPYLSVCRGFKGELALRRGDAAVSVEGLRLCLEELHAAHHELLTTAFTIALAQGLVAIDRPIEGITLIDETIGVIEAKDGDIPYLPELLRVRGNAFLSMSQRKHNDAETCFRRSLESSRRRGAQAWELRTAVDLAALLAADGQSQNARAVLQPVFERFLEGSKTADLRAAQRLLATLT